MVEASCSKPRSQRINQILQQVYELEVLKREIKRTNAKLTKKNTELHNSLLEMRGMYVLLKRRNMRLMKDNSRLYMMIIILRLQKKDPNPKTHLALETLPEEAISL